MIRFRYWLKYFLLGMSVSLLIILSQPSLMLAQRNKEVRQNQAELLTQKGHEQLNQGQASNAYETWKQAAKLYHQLHDSEGVSGSLINQNLALQALGLYSRACKTTLEALKMDKWICDSSSKQPDEFTVEKLRAAIHQVDPIPVNLLGLHNLGDALRLIGKLDESEIVLKEILSIAQTVTPKQDISSVLFSLANTKESMYERAQNQYKWIEDTDFKKQTVTQIQQNALFSLDYYQQVDNTANTTQSIKIKSQLRRLNILLDFDRWLTTQPKSSNTHLATVNANINQQIKPLIEQLLKNSSIFSQLPPSESIFAQLNFAESLNKTSNKQFQSLAIQYAESALQSAKSIDSQRLESYSLGSLGKLQPEKSQAYFESALGLAQSINALDIAYEWQQQLGDVYTKQGKSEAALQAYSAAIKNLTYIRGNLLPSNPDTPFFFYEKIEPVYRSYMRLLLENPHLNLDKVVQINEELQLAELENYLQCSTLDLVALNNLKNLTIIPSVIHIIDLGNSIQVIVQSPDKSLHYHSVDSKLVKVHTNHLLQTLQDRNFANTINSVIIDYSQALYNSLIAPIKKYLPPDGTLVFTLDTSFQNLPMGLLYDGKDYLLKHYNIAETLGSKVRQPKLLPKKKLRALIAGLSKSSPSFQAANAPKDLTGLPSVLEEITNVKEQTNSSLLLLNEEFTYKRFIKEVSTENFPIIHLTTHAQFNSVPQLTMFFSWDKPINLLEFDSLLKQKNQINEDAIELLVLSGCETAKGNKRSALGIAGIAAQAGARSTVATLWRVDDKSTALLMKEFYKELKDGKTKTEALRLAQLSLLSNPKYSHPYYWAGFLLIGGWL